MTNKIYLTPEQEAWMIKHYKHTPNEEICKRFGISLSTMQRIKRELGLSKSRQFMQKCQANASEKAKESHLRNGTYPPKGYRVPGSENNCFKKGERHMTQTNADGNGICRKRQSFGSRTSPCLKQIIAII